jgi:hypothetical protein
MPVLKRSNRRSSRIPFVASIVISGKDSSGKPFRAPGETIDVNVHGAKIRTTANVVAGMEIQVTLAARQRTRAAQVVWESISRNGEFGIELRATADFWGIRFPTESHYQSQDEARQADTQIAVSAQSCPHDVPIAPAEKFRPQPESDFCADFPNMVEASSQRIPVRVTGISTVFAPFEEATVFESEDHKQAVLLLSTMVAVGAKLRIIFPEHDRVIAGRVKRTYKLRQTQKWNVGVELLGV